MFCSGIYQDSSNRQPPNEVSRLHCRTMEHCLRYLHTSGMEMILRNDLKSSAPSEVLSTGSHTLLRHNSINSKGRDRTVVKGATPCITSKISVSVECP